MTLHIRHDGRSVDVDAAALGLNAAMSDAQVKARAAAFLDINPRDLDDAVVDRTDTALIVRPAAIYG